MISLNLLLCTNLLLSNFLTKILLFRFNNKFSLKLTHFIIISILKLIFIKVNFIIELDFIISENDKPEISLR